jgi:hypothetical protein
MHGVHNNCHASASTFKKYLAINSLEGCKSYRKSAKGIKYMSNIYNLSLKQVLSQQEICWRSVQEIIMSSGKAFIIAA